MAAVLQQCVQRHHQRAAQRTHQHQCRQRQPHAAGLCRQRHRHTEQHTQRQHTRRVGQRHPAPRQRCTGNNAHRHCRLQVGALAQRQVQHFSGPAQHGKLQHRSGAPEEGGHRHRQTPLRVGPQTALRAPKVHPLLCRAPALAGITCAAVGDAGVQHGGQRVQAEQQPQRQRRGCHNAVRGQRQRQPRADEKATERSAEDHRAHRADFDPGVGRHQALGRQQFGHQAIFRRCVSGCAHAHDSQRQQRVQARQQAQQAHRLEAVHGHHQPALLHRVGKRAHKRRQHHIGQREAELQHRRPPARQAALQQQCDADDEQGVVGQGRTELRGDEDGKAAVGRAGDGGAGGVWQKVADCRLQIADCGLRSGQTPNGACVHAAIATQPCDNVMRCAGSAHERRLMDCLTRRGCDIEIKV